MQNSAHSAEESAAPASPASAWRARVDAREPHLVRGPFTRWPRAADATLATVVFAGSVVAVAASAVDDGEAFRLALIGDLPVAAFVLLGVAAVSLFWRRAHALAVTGVVLGVMFVWAIGGLGDGQDLALVVAAYSVGRYVADRRASIAALVAIFGASILDSFIDSTQRVDIVPVAVIVAVPWYVGARVRNRGAYVRLLQERAERVEAEQQARAVRAVAEERARIARELHDIVAHRVSMMTVQAGAARSVARDDLDLAVDAMGDVERAGRQALGELRHLLGVLRPGDGGPDRLGPQPALRDVRGLTEALERTGADVVLDLCEPAIELPLVVEVSAYRIVQESLTNVVKHAGPDPSVCVAIGVDGPELSIEVTNTITRVEPIRAASDLPASGYGIAGMRERAELLGGTLRTELLADGRHRVHAGLPLSVESS